MFALTGKEDVHMTMTVNNSNFTTHTQTASTFLLLYVGPNSLSYACHNGQCVGDFSISEGEECFHDEKDFNDFLSSSFQCKEGLCCIPENRSHENFKCRKVTTKLKDKKTCTNDSDCPIDSFCGCNNKDGIVQCIPYPVSSKKLKNKIVSMQEDFHECVVKHYDTWMQCYTILNEFYAYIGEEVFPYHSEYRCSDHSLFGAASTVTVSFMAVVAALLFVLF